MPCYTIITVTLNLENADIDLVKATLEEKGYRVQHNGDMLTWGYNNSYNDQTKELKSSNNMDWFNRAYTMQVVQEKADRWGWRIEEGESENEFTIYKR